MNILFTYTFNQRKRRKKKREKNKRGGETAARERSRQVGKTETDGLRQSRHLQNNV